jgi:FAD/FMN-containing dehydrogenase
MFRHIEPLFREAGGRPHWGKLHSLGRKELAALYPMFEQANAVRRTLDPQGRMLNPFLKKLFGDG